MSIFGQTLSACPLLSLTHAANTSDNLNSSFAEGAMPAVKEISSVKLCINLSQPMLPVMSAQLSANRVAWFQCSDCRVDFLANGLPDAFDILPHVPVLLQSMFMLVIDAVCMHHYMRIRTLCHQSMHYACIAVKSFQVFVAQNSTQCQFECALPVSSQHVRYILAL